MTSFMPSRRDILGLAAGAMTTGLLAGKGLAQKAMADSLGDLAARAGLLYGASIAAEVDSDRDYAALYARETRIVTTDYAMKFDALRPSADRFDFEAADRIVAFAKANRLLVRGHTLVWNENAPDWLKRMSSAEIERVFDAHIETMVSRYAGQIHSWDVVNEPFWPDHGKPGGYRDGPWFAAMGEGFVARAFKRAAAIDSKAKLVLNEAHCEIDNSWGRGIRPRLYMLAERLRDQGVPVHAIGLQGHLQPQWPYDDRYFRAYLDRIGRLGYDIYITELDVNDESFDADPVRRDEQVARRYADFLGQVLSVKAVKMVVNWQLSDKYSWYADPGLARKVKGWRHRPLPFDERFARKPAWRAMADAFAGRSA